MARVATADQSILEMAIVGYESQKARIDAAIADIRARLRHRRPVVQKASKDGPGRAHPVRRVLSAAASRRIALAQKKPWVAQRAATAKTRRPKRKMSAAGRAAIIAATKKRWAAFRKAKAEAEKKAAAARWK